jgi:hypothetical protein
MPWHIESDHPECSGYGVVKDGTRELEGCHRTLAQAEAQMAALYASEPEGRAAGQMDDLEDDPEGEREQRIVTDIDGTIVLNGTRPVRRIIDEINSAGITVYVLTGRPENRRAETEQLLADVGLVYDELYMVGSQQAKRAKIADLASEYDIVTAYENDATARAHYETFGVPLASLRSRSAYVEEMLAELRSARYSSNSDTPKLTD